MLPGVSFTYYVSYVEDLMARINNKNSIQGEEIGMTDNNDFPISDSRDPNRTPMQWDDTVSAGILKLLLDGKRYNRKLQQDFQQT